MPELKVPVPEDIFWLEEQITSLIQPAAFLRQDTSRMAPKGATRTWGEPDVPATGPLKQIAQTWMQSPYDGDAFYLQLNMGEIPEAVRKPEWPKCGVVWVCINLRNGWSGHAVFDPRPAEEIIWSSSSPSQGAYAATWVIDQTLPDATPGVLPDLAWTPRYSPPQGEAYTNWVMDKYLGSHVSDFQIGGWVWPIQGEFDDRNKDFVCALDRQEFGDSGAIYLHYNQEVGFFVHVETC
jgi:hypothetical protein